MCKAKNEPGGPSRCSHHMSKKFEASKARYAAEVETVYELEQELRRISNSREMVEELLYDDDPSNDEDAHVRIESLEELEQATRKERDEHKRKMNQWRKRLKGAQLDLDSTRGGLQTLSEDYNSLGKRLKEDEELEDDDPQKLSLESREEIEYERSLIMTRFHRGRNKLESERRQRNGASENNEEYNLIDNNKPQNEEEPHLQNEEGEELIDPELDQELDRMIDDLDISGVDKKTGSFIDPDSGEEVSEHEITAIAKRRRFEARARIRRHQEAEGDNRALLKSFLRIAIYRALRYNRSTRKITRLIGVGHFNSFLEKFDNVRDERKRDKLVKKRDKWHGKRIMHLESELDLVQSTHKRDKNSHAEALKSLAKDRESEKLSEKEYDRLVAQENQEFKTRDKESRRRIHELENERIEWAQEKLDTLRRKEKQDEELRRAVLRKRQQRDELNSAVEDSLV